MRGVGKGGRHRDAGAGAKQCVVGLVREMGEAGGFQILEIGHEIHLPFAGRWKDMTGQIFDGLMLFICETPCIK
jgi:hypothetical protein